MDQRLYTVDEAADFLQIHPKTLRRKIREGEIQSTRVGKRYRFTEAQLRDYLGEGVQLPTPPRISLQRRTVVTSVVDVSVVSPEQHSQISNYLNAALANAGHGDSTVKTSVHCSYFPETGELKVMLSGEIGAVQSLLRMIDAFLGNREEAGE